MLTTGSEMRAAYESGKMDIKQIMYASRKSYDQVMALMREAGTTFVLGGPYYGFPRAFRWQAEPTYCPTCQRPKPLRG